MIRFDIVSDISCPFCMLGFLQLRKALVKKNREAKIHWHPFDISQNTPAEGMDVRQNLFEKYGMSAQACDASFDNFVKQGAELGFDYNFPQGKRGYNGKRAHQLVAWAQSLGVDETPIVLALFTAYFRDSLNYSDAQTLSEIAGSVGLDAREARSVLEDKRFETQVNTAIETWQGRGITGVPAFVINEEYLVSGAQGVEAFVEIIGEITTV